MSQTVDAWNLRGVSPEARAAAMECAAEAGLPLGAWLAQAISEQNSEELIAKTEELETRPVSGGFLKTDRESRRLSSIERAMLRGSGNAPSFGMA